MKPYVVSITLLLSSFIPTVTTSSSSVVRPRPALKRSNELRIERNLVPEHVASRLYNDILEAAVPYPQDNFHTSLLGFKGDAGARIEQQMMTNAERAQKFQEMISDNNKNNSLFREKKESGILRLEYLKQGSHDRVKKLIHKVVENSVLEEEGGTIHVYVSRPHAAALANHTDTTDIVVLQLVGAKEWFLCQEKEKTLRGKLSTCAAYDEREISGLECKRETIYPGDALYLPKRIVHSARATEEGVSAHLTFGFSERMCFSEPETPFGPSSSFHRGLADDCEGGSSCDLSCDSGCDSGCTCGCDFGTFYNCNECCNSQCDSGCDLSCDSGCPGSSPRPAPAPAPSSSSSSSSSQPQASSSGLSGGAVAGIVISVLLLVMGAATGGLLFYTWHMRNSEDSQESESKDITSPPEAAMVAEDHVQAEQAQGGVTQVAINKMIHSDGKVTVKETTEDPIENTVTENIWEFDNEEAATKAGY